ncbi:MqnA/MqnD/SBP family protein [Sulfurospirillum arcachonense]|uniref:MqnA/MqnD/SBP family protein n=1 Tax=Sulfurospirillum arcachonense TaxID=57666 RepID=UPI00046852EA|nr:MqnA/MqnD/SBP family protein [Sulfurospirillum arcachonense]
MIFGKIDYINLLPFHIYLKQSSLTNALKKSCEYKKSYPSHINKQFRSRRVDGAFISSIESNRKSIKTLPLGIVAKKQVTSVLVKKGTLSSNDPHSASSNALAKVLKINGEVYIGDKALKLYLESPQDYIDLAHEWHNRYSLPFVFARLSINKHFSIYKKISDNFKNKRIRIPQYILKKYAHERQIPPQEILKYLKLISYKIGEKERRGLNLFFKKEKLSRENI